MQILYLRTETLHENGDQQIEENIITERHQRDEIQCCPVAGLFHAVE